jgi:CubicO group peptidase (beta-lactamase class C family)
MRRLVSNVAVLAALAGALGVSSQQAPDAQAVPIEQRIDALIERQMAVRHIPGLSLGVVRDGQLVLAKGYGDATLEWTQPATPDTVYLLASMTKQFTAAAIMLLVGDGKVGLDDPLAKYVDAPPQWTGITVRHLLTHTAGLKDRFEAGQDGRMYLDYTTKQMFDAAARTPVDASPGARWQYSDQGYFLLGMVVEKASGQSYGTFLRDRIFTPAAMTSTTLHNWNLIVRQRADGYGLIGETLVGSRRRYQFALVPHFGVQSTVRDLAKYDAAISAGTILSASIFEQMSTPARLSDGRPADVAGIGYGFGWFLERFRGHREIHHGGSTGTCLYRLPDDKLTVILLTNLEQASGSDPCGIARMVAATYVPAIAIVSVPPLSDTDAARTSRLRAAIEALAKGTPDPADYNPAQFPALQAAARSQRARFESLGPLSTFELIADDAAGSRVLWYRARYRDSTLHFRFVLNAEDRITNIQSR